MPFLHLDPRIRSKNAFVGSVHFLIIGVWDTTKHKTKFHLNDLIISSKTYAFYSGEHQQKNCHRALQLYHKILPCSIALEVALSSRV